MARPKKTDKKPIEQYDHKGKERVNNPPVGLDTQQDKTKREFLNEWVRAVNEHGGFGKWTWAVSKDPADVRMTIEDAIRI